MSEGFKESFQAMKRELSNKRKTSQGFTGKDRQRIRLARNELYHPMYEITSRRLSLPRKYGCNI